jgi:hypothetical protein
MEEYALEKLKDYKDYGLMIVEDVGINRVNSCVRVAQKAKRLHSENVSEQAIRKILLRTSSDLCNHYLKHELESKMLNVIREVSEVNVEGELNG